MSVGFYVGLSFVWVFRRLSRIFVVFSSIFLLILGYFVDIIPGQAVVGYTPLMSPLFRTLFSRSIFAISRRCRRDFSVRCSAVVVAFSAFFSGDDVPQGTPKEAIGVVPVVSVEREKRAPRSDCIHPPGRSRSRQSRS